MRCSYKEVRNKDYVEVTVKKDDAVVFRGAYVYGFRNIQNLVMKIKVAVWEAGQVERKVQLRRRGGNGVSQVGTRGSVDVVAV